MQPFRSPQVMILKAGPRINLDDQVTRGAMLGEIPAVKVAGMIIQPYGRAPPHVLA